MTDRELLLAIIDNVLNELMSYLCQDISSGSLIKLATCRFCVKFLKSISHDSDSEGLK